MKFYEAKVADVLRLSQRDGLFLRESEDKVRSLLKLMGPRSYYKTSSTVPAIVNFWYYLMTTMGNLQTLGEEYTGTIRVNRDKKIPEKMVHVIWLILHIGGEPILDRLLDSSRNKINKSSGLTQEAKDLFLKIINFLKQEKPALKRIHNSLFYINGNYYFISNRMTGIRYVLLRQWLQDDSFSGSFRLLGHLSLFYVLFDFVNRFFFRKTNSGNVENVTANVSQRECALCGENIKSASTTPCGHIFCWSCIHDSLKYQKICPICRESVTPNRIVFLQNYI